MTEQQNSHESWSDEQKWSYLVRHERLGELLVRNGKLTLGQLELALKEQEASKSPRHLGEIIVDKNYLSLDEIVATLDKQKKLHQTSEQTIQQLKAKEKSKPVLMRFEGKAALVTGAGSGIGRATALLLAKQGCLVAALDIDAASMNLLAAELKQLAPKNFGYFGDIGKAADVNDFVEAAGKSFGRIDFLFNNAGVEFISALEDTSEGQWDHVHDTNMKGTFLVTKAALPHMRAIGAGAIVNNASDAGLRGIKLNAAYSSSKAGIIHLTRCLALDYGRYNIRCNCICPGCIKTPLCERFNAEVGARKGISGEQALQGFVEAMIPMLRVGLAEEVAALVSFLFSDEASYISGAVIPIDGGLTAGM